MSKQKREFKEGQYLYRAANFFRDGFGIKRYVLLKYDLEKNVFQIGNSKMSSSAFVYSGDEEMLYNYFDTPKEAFEDHKNKKIQMLNNKIKNLYSEINETQKSLDKILDTKLEDVKAIEYSDDWEPMTFNGE
jgi:vacuolar-type H+-ATPase subunit I/STV1